MSSQVSIHEASPDERLRAYHDVHAFWGGGLPLDEFLARRLRSIAHNRAQWWVLTIDGAVATSMARYPLSFGWWGQVLPGFGVGSVYTVEEHRGQGHAETLLREVARNARCEGRRLALLYSDIRPSYYEKLGYRTLPSVSYRCERLGELSSAATPALLRRFDPDEHVGRLAELYAAEHSADELFVARDAEYWRFAIRRAPLDAYFWVECPVGRERGYARLTPRFGDECLLELALVQRDAELWQSALSAVAAIAAQAGARALAGWLRGSEVVDRWFTSTNRTQAVPMVCPLDDALGWPLAGGPPRCHFWQGDHF
jgi:GNAT superfamily N-acetyltransferase